MRPQARRGAIDGTQARAAAMCLPVGLLPDEFVDLHYRPLPTNLGFWTGQTR